MVHSASFQKYPQRISFIGSYPPRECGIAVFTSDLLHSLKKVKPETELWAVAINDRPEGYSYSNEVRFEIDQNSMADYQLAADFLNVNRTEFLCLQHEFGVYGGNEGTYILGLLKLVKAPLVTTLHTVLADPTSRQLNITKRLAQYSDCLVVMSNKAQEILKHSYGIPRKKITVIPHGIPDVPFTDPSCYKKQFGLEEKKVILTFGLLSPNKGIETVIDALPKIAEKHPDILYIVLGVSHPHIKRKDSETYRYALHCRAKKLGVIDHIVFHNRFVSLEELLEYIGAADIYITPYLQREQITSGTLAYAIGCGKAVISTPYWYAEELLANGRGILTPWGNAQAISDAVNTLLSDHTKRQRMRKRAYTYSRAMIWKAVALKYHKLFREITAERGRNPRPVLLSKSRESQPKELPCPKLDHVVTLTDDTGILQHARYTVPDRNHGYCTDDNARALIAVLRYQEQFSETKETRSLITTYLSFLQHAFHPKTGRFRNFMGYDRHWKEDNGSQDCQGRALWALGEAAVCNNQKNIQAAAMTLLREALPVLYELDTPRSWAFSLAGLHAYLKRYGGDSEARRLRDTLAERLFSLYQSNASRQWPWLESVLTYANGKIPQALITSGHTLAREDMYHAGIETLSWIISLQTDLNNCFSPIGNAGWAKKGKLQARFDQQPIEALHIIEACREAYEITKEQNWMDHAQRCIDWFFGQNSKAVSLYDSETGGCCDGLQPHGPNRNQGAESTLVCLLSLLEAIHVRNVQISLKATQTGEENRIFSVQRKSQ